MADIVIFITDKTFGQDKTGDVRYIGHAYAGQTDDGPFNWTANVRRGSLAPVVNAAIKAAAVEAARVAGIPFDPILEKVTIVGGLSDL